ncbi:MAG: hypothetical protein H0A75_07930 [Candidatus Methanofishera endochildressiae]|uniref:Uncharacterized protein n=1 Tax=Candidatus Methanofishera endochildressiae TaxID=2738884 RepID=A0A7Z0SE69_9GAMM|nr:hypothetical protein [Candidatus Methanofishera endochildressiae]
MSIADLSVVNDGMVHVSFNSQNKIYVQNFKGSVIIHGANGGSVDGVSKTPSLINLFPEVSIQANKSLIIDTFVKAYVSGASGDTDFLGLNVATNIKINGTWYSLGNSGQSCFSEPGGSGMATYAAKKF